MKMTHNTVRLLRNQKTGTRISGIVVDYFMGKANTLTRTMAISRMAPILGSRRQALIVFDMLAKKTTVHELP